MQFVVGQPRAPNREEAGASPRICDFLRKRCDDVIDVWKERVQALSPAQGLEERALVDHLPDILRHIADAVDPRTPVGTRDIGEGLGDHALDRLARGFDLDEVIREYALLKRIILEQWRAHIGGAIDVEDMAHLDDAFDEAVAESALRYARARERTLLAVDSVAEAALGTTDLDTFLARLLRAILDLTASIDSAVVLLKEPDELLHVRAAVGLEEELTSGFAIRVGEGFAGTIAKTAQPLFLKEAARHPLVRSDILKRSGMRALYGVPLCHGDEVIGVAHMGSRTATEFSDEDMLLLRMMGARATSLIVQAQIVQRERDARHDLEAAHRQVVRFAVQESKSRARAEQAQHALDAARMVAEQNSALLDTLLSRSPVGFALLDTNSRYVRINAALAHSHGSDIASHIGRAPREVMDDAAAAADVEACLARVRATGEPLVGQELTYRRAHDAATHWLMSYYPVPGDDGSLIGVGKIAVDVTERKNAADAQRFMAEASKLLARSLDVDETLTTLARIAVPYIADLCAVNVVRAPGTDAAAPELVTVVHKDPAVVERARALQGHFFDATGGIARALATGTPILWADVDPAAVKARARNEEHAALLASLDLRSIIIVPLIARGRVLGVLVFVRGSDRARFDDKDLEAATDLAGRAALAADNARLYHDARLAAEQREDILAVVSHDLRNPLNAMSLASSLVAKRIHGLVNDAAIERHLGTMQRSVARMTSLIDEVLTMGSIQAGTLAIEKTDVDAGGLVDEAVSLMAPMAEEKGVCIEARVEDPGAVVRCDRERMLQVFSNLLGNAIKFTRNGDSITVRASTRDDGVELSVKDTGPGIKPEEVPHIFERYFSGREKKKQGTGLGLYIAKGIVDAHGGRIWVDSTVDRGATFRIFLPTK